MLRTLDLSQAVRSGRRRQQLLHPFAVAFLSMEQSCPRCGATLPVVDDAPAAFCAHCGLPQLTVSEQAMQPAHESLLPGHVAGMRGSSASERNTSVDWPVALRILAVATLIGVVPAAVIPGSVIDGTVSGLSLMLTPLLSLAAVGFYHRSRPLREVSPAVGTRMGAVLGLLMGSLIALITGIAGFALRYHYRSHVMDDKIKLASDAMLAQVMATSPPPPELLNFLHSPEFLAGSVIAGHTMTLLLLVFAGSFCGWLAGALLRARRQRHAG
jgi:hypothetical protein